MSVDKSPTDEPDGAPHLSTEEARQGEIILKRRWQRLLFLIGLAAAMLLAIILLLAGGR